MNLIIPMMLSTLAFQAPVPLSYNYTFPLGTELNPRLFPFQSASLQAQLENVDLLQLGTQSFQVEEELNTYTFSFTFTNEQAIIRPLVGFRPFLSKVAFNDTHRFIEIFNPTLEVLPIDQYGIILNETAYTFNDGLMLPSMSSMKIDMLVGTPLPGTIGPNDPIVTFARGNQIKFWDGNTNLIIDSLPFTSVIQTLYGEASLDDHIFTRIPTMATPPFEYDDATWIPTANDEPIEDHELFTPTITPLMQAKAWGHYVMFGAGMNSRNREVEAYEAIADELWLMDPLSLEAIYEFPTTTFQGLNQYGRLTSSTLTQAVRRYNRLSTYLPGAGSLVDPGPIDETGNFIWLGSMVSLGLVGVLVLIGAMASKKKTVHSARLKK